jgi:hypothetical protein
MLVMQMGCMDEEAILVLVTRVVTEEKEQLVFLRFASRSDDLGLHAKARNMTGIWHLAYRARIRSTW